MCKEYKTIAREGNVALFITLFDDCIVCVVYCIVLFVLFVYCLLYSRYELSSYHPEEVLDMDLMCPIAIKKNKITLPVL